MPHRSDTTDSYTSAWDYAMGGGIAWGGLLLILIILKLLEDSA